MKRERGSTSYGGASLLRVRLRRLFRVDVCKERGLLLLTLHYYLRARALVESRPVRPERKATSSSSSSSSVLAPYPVRITSPFLTLMKPQTFFEHF